MNLHVALNINLKRINQEIENIVKQDKDVSSSSMLSHSILTLIRSGGKRIRPMMVIVGSRFGSNNSGKLQMKLAAAAEFIHVASLVHDDIIDQSDMRRGQPALHTQTGVSEAVHIGSYMSARVIELLSIHSSDRERFVHDLSSISTAQLCLGEYEQLEHMYDYDITIEQYLEKSRNKTAQLIATCLRVGALSTGTTPDVADLLYQYGEYVGMSFQIQDDLLDFTQTSDMLGKPAGNDLIHGQVTLPVLYALQIPELSPRIRAIHSDSTPEAIEHTLEIIRSSGALEMTEQLNQQYLAQAQAIIDQLTSYPAHQDLQILLQYFSKRET